MPDPVLAMPMARPRCLSNQPLTVCIHVAVNVPAPSVDIITHWP